MLLVLGVWFVLVFGTGLSLSDSMQGLHTLSFSGPQFYRNASDATAMGSGL